jgi:hypothetical protein
MRSKPTFPPRENPTTPKPCRVYPLEMDLQCAVPSELVSRTISEAHKKWLKDPRRDGGPHNSTTMRRLPILVRGVDDKYYGADWAPKIAVYRNNFGALNGPEEEKVRG